MEHTLCVLIDFENLAAGTEKEGLGRFDLRPILRRLKDKGRILVSRSYGDWGRFAKFKQSLLEQGVNMIELTSYRGAEKNRADIALVVDAMEIAYTRSHIDTFVVVSGDSDFTPLVMRLKELNKRVIGIGTRGSSSRLLVECCDEFMFYESLYRDRHPTPERDRYSEQEYEPAYSPEPSRRESYPSAYPNYPAPSAPAYPAPAYAASGSTAAPSPTPQPSATVVAPPAPRAELPAAPPIPVPDRESAFALLVETLQGIQRDDPGPVLAGLVKQSMQRKEPAFDETEYGYSGFARFLEAARDKSLVILRRSEKAGGYQVELAGLDPVLPEVGSMPAEVAPVVEEAEIDEVPLAGPAGRLRGVLDAAGFHPATHFSRHTVVHELVDHVQERQARKKRNTLMYAYGDIARRCRKTDPYVPARTVRGIINALKAAGEITHADGRPIRSHTAQFVIKKEAEDLLESLRRFYIRLLIERGEVLDDSTAISLLLWGDEQHRQEAEELVAWVQRENELRRQDGPVVDPSAWLTDSATDEESRSASDARERQAQEDASWPEASPTWRPEAPRPWRPTPRREEAEPARFEPAVEAPAIGLSEAPEERAADRGEPAFATPSSVVAPEPTPAAAVTPTLEGAASATPESADAAPPSSAVAREGGGEGAGEGEGEGAEADPEAAPKRRRPRRPSTRAPKAPKG